MSFLFKLKSHNKEIKPNLWWNAGTTTLFIHFIHWNTTGPIWTLVFLFYRPSELISINLVALNNYSSQRFMSSMSNNNNIKWQRWDCKLRGYVVFSLRSETGRRKVVCLLVKANVKSLYPPPLHPPSSFLISRPKPSTGSSRCATRWTTTSSQAGGRWGPRRQRMWPWRSEVEERKYRKIILRQSKMIT